MEHHYFTCECSHPAHTLRFVLDEQFGTLWFEMYLNPVWPWYKRVWFALRYIFNAKQDHNYFDETLLRREEYTRLAKLLNKSETIYLMDDVRRAEIARDKEPTGFIKYGDCGLKTTPDLTKD